MRIISGSAAGRGTARPLGHEGPIPLPFRPDERLEGPIPVVEIAAVRGFAVEIHLDGRDLPAEAMELEVAGQFPFSSTSSSSATIDGFMPLYGHSREAP
jgi:hypothetical protein